MCVCTLYVACDYIFHVHDITLICVSLSCPVILYVCVNIYIS